MFRGFRWLVAQSVRKPWRMIALHVVLLLALTALVIGLLVKETVGVAQEKNKDLTLATLVDAPLPIREHVANRMLLRIFDNAPPYTVGEGFDELAWYRQFQQDWPPPDEVFLLDVRPPAALGASDQLRRMKRLVSALRDAEVPYINGLYWAGTVSGRPAEILDQADPSTADLEAVHRVIERDPSAALAYYGKPDGTSWAVYAFVDPTIDHSDLARLGIETRLTDVVQGALGADAIRMTPSPDGWTAIVAGTGSATGAMLNAVTNVVTKDFLIVNLVILVLCLAVFRNPRTVAIAVTCILQGETLTVLPMLAWRGAPTDPTAEATLLNSSGSPFDWITANLASSIFLMGIAGSVHLIHTYLLHREDGKAVEPSIIEAIGSEARPYFWTLITTCMSLVAMAETSTVASVTRYGRFATIGLLFGLLTNFTLLPALLVVFDRPQPSGRHGVLISRVVTYLTDWSWRNPIVVLSLGFLLTVGGCWATIFHTRFDGNIIEYFPPGLSSHMAERAATVAKRWGIVPYFVELRRPDGESWLARDHVEELDRFGEMLRSDPQLNAISPTRTALTLADAARGVCTTTPDQIHCEEGLPVAEDLDLAVPGTPLGIMFTPLDRSEPGDRTRALVLTDPFWASRGPQLETELSRLAAASLPGLMGPDGAPRCLVGLSAPQGRPTLSNTGILALAEEWLRPRSACVPSVRLQGMIHDWYAMEGAILSGYSRSLILSIIPNILVLAFLFRRRTLFLLSVLPNLTPCFVAVGVIGLLTPAIPSPAAFSVSIATGIIADDTMFYLTHLRSHLAEGKPIRVILMQLVREASVPVVATNLALVAGFATLVGADLRPVAYLGGLLSLTIFVAMLCDIFLLPAALSIVERYNVRIEA